MLHLIFSLICGAIIGSIAGKFMKSKHGFFFNAVLGIVGGAVGGFLGDIIGSGDGFLVNLVLSVLGSCVVIWVGRRLSK